LETPIFTKLVTENEVERQPMWEVIKRNPREIILSAFVRVAVSISSQPTYTLTEQRRCSSLVAFCFLPYSPPPCCRSFRCRCSVTFPTGSVAKKMCMIGAAAVGVFGFIYFGLLNSGSATLIFIAIVLSLIPHDMMCGAQAALIAESFTGRLRYSGASLGYQLASVIAGGPAPLIAAWLFATYHSGYSIAMCILICAIISLIATAMMTDYTGKNIEGEYE